MVACCKEQFPYESIWGNPDGSCSTYPTVPLQFPRHSSYIPPAITLPVVADGQMYSCRCIPVLPDGRMCSHCCLPLQFPWHSTYSSSTTTQPMVPDGRMYTHRCIPHTFPLYFPQAFLLHYPCYYTTWQSTLLPGFT